MNVGVLLDRVAVGYVSILCPIDCACNHCGVVVGHHTYGWRQRFGHKDFLCRACMIREATGEDDDADA